MASPCSGETIRLKKKYTAVIIVAMIVGVALLASLVYGSVQDSRIAYITVRTDKDVYTSDENVTFRLVPLTEGLEFTLDGSKNPYQNGVHVIRIPDDVDPGEVVTDTSLLYQIGSWGRGRIILPIETFSSGGEPLEMSWNGTMSINNELTGGVDWAKATSGYYLLYPRLERSQGHVTKFMMDDAAVFYYESLNVNISAVHSYDSFSMSMGISLGEGMSEGEYELRSRLYPMKYDAMEPGNRYFNETFILAPGAPHAVKIGPVEADSHVGAIYDAVVVGPDGRLFAFGIIKSPGGEWYNDHRY